ncbi:PP2C family protein-serine/threonine phosphatase [Heliophilum fasciatum]|nr:fused response regulator/phosphatase [Heliophilum fasciatum]MCW2279268.1 sigma-B regulation protein RsbU (phosphoserine phosphatase) [Heliophilum fasciatum]
MKKSHILVVDDDKVFRCLITKILNRAGYAHISTASSAEEALGFLGLIASGDQKGQKPEPVDLILMDMLMPGMSGIEMCRCLQQDEQLRFLPVIMVTAEDRREYIQEALDGGAVDYIVKPVEAVVLQARLRVALRLKKEMDRRIRREMEIQQQLHLARRLQEGLMPGPLCNPEIAITGAALYSEKLTGDLYYWVQVSPLCYGVILVDVMGHGIPSALVCMSIRSLLAGIMTYSRDPGEVIQELNRHMVQLYRKRTGTSYYLTAVCLFVDLEKRQITCVSAGHPPGICLIDDGEPVLLESSCPPVGMMPAVPVVRRGAPLGTDRYIHTPPLVLHYQHSAKILLYTDGLVDYCGQSYQETAKVLARVLHEERSADDFVDYIMEPIRVRQRITDDISLIAMNIPGP